MPDDELLLQGAEGGGRLPPGPLPPEAITCEVLTNWDAVRAMQPEWDGFVAATRADLYFTCDWCRTWWQFYGQRYRLHILLLRQAGRLVGLLPMMIDRLWLGPVPLKLAKIVGSDFTTVVFEPPVEAACAEAVYAAALRHLLEHAGCDAVRLAPLSGYRPHREQIRRACASDPRHLRLVRDRDINVHNMQRLPASYDAYLASLPRKHRSELYRVRRQFEGRYSLLRETIDDPARVEAAFDEFLAMHQARWLADGRPGYFGELPRSEAFNRELIRALSPKGFVWMTRLQADGQTIAWEYDFAFNGMLYGWLGARRTDEPWGRMNVSRLSMLGLFETCMQRGIHLIDVGAGAYPYKRGMGAEEAPVVSIVIAANRPWPAFKSGTLLRLYWACVNLLFERLWYRRIMPRMPRWLRRPRWQLWLRARV